MAVKCKSVFPAQNDTIENTMTYLKILMRKHIMAAQMLLLPLGGFCQSADIGLYGSDVYTGGDVAIHGGLSASGQAYWHNDGTVHFRNGAGVSNKTDDTLFAGHGVLYFHSDTPQIISGNPVSASSVTVENPAGLLLRTDLSVTVQAKLEDGVIGTGINTLYIRNNADSALLADMSQTSSRYVNGKLCRLVSTGDTRSFPIGDTSSVHPLVISNNGSTGAYTARYLPHYDALTGCFPSIFYYGYTFDSFFGNGAWQISADGVLSFDMDAYHFAPTGYDAKHTQYTLGYSPEGQCTGWVLAGEQDFSTASASNVYEDFVRGRSLRSGGYYAILSALKNELDIVNLIRLDDGSETRFIIPNVWEYLSNSLQIFSRWGTKVYDGETYDNSFDFKEAQAGTYYYVFKYTDADGKKHEVKSFVEVVK